MTRLLFFLFAACFMTSSFAEESNSQTEPQTVYKAEQKTKSAHTSKPATQQKPPGRPPAIVVTETATLESIAPTAFYSATVISRDDANLSAELAGRITWVAEVGDRINAGSPVVKLDDVFIKQQVIEERSTIQSEKAQFDLHSKEVKRFTELLEHNNVARSQLDQAVSDQAVARSNMAAARARLTQAEERLRRTNILAPFDGVVSERLLQTGEWASNGSTIVRLVSASNLEIQTHIPANSLRFISIGTTLTYTDASISGKGKVRALVPIGGDASRLYELRIASETDENTLVAGKLLRVAIPTEHEREAVLVPRDALVLRREGVYVFRVNSESIAERIQVETGISDLHRIEVIGGIKADDAVITRGGENLRSGMTVTAKPLQAGS